MIYPDLQQLPPPPPFFFLSAAWVARFGSPLFLLTQMVIVVDVTQAWNDAWVEAGDEDETWLYGLLAATLGALGGCVALAALCFHFFAPASQDCSLNLTLISLTLVLVVVMALTSFHPAVEAGSLFPAAAVGLYVSYMGYSALQSEPRDYACNGLGARLGAASGATLAGGMLLTLLSVVYSAFRAGSNTQTFAGAWAGGNGAGAEPLLAGDAELTSAGLDGVAPAAPRGMDRGGAGEGAALPARAQEEDAPVPYCYAQFYAVFALASMYIAMLMTGWGATGQPKASDAAAGCSVGSGGGGLVWLFVGDGSGRAVMGVWEVRRIGDEFVLSARRHRAGLAVGSARLCWGPVMCEVGRDRNCDVSSRPAPSSAFLRPHAADPAAAVSWAPSPQPPLSWVPFPLQTPLSNVCHDHDSHPCSPPHSQDAVDVGWTSVWVKIVTQWVAAALYCWTLLAPSLFPDRVFG